MNFTSLSKASQPKINNTVSRPSSSRRKEELCTYSKIILHHNELTNLSLIINQLPISKQNPQNAYYPVVAAEKAMMVKLQIEKAMIYGEVAEECMHACMYACYWSVEVMEFRVHLWVQGLCIMLASPLVAVGGCSKLN